LIFIAAFIGTWLAVELENRDMFQKMWL